jgi:hypothetical protein
VNFAIRHRPIGRRTADELELQLMRCRRRDERAWILVVRASGCARVVDLLTHLRMTDAARVEVNVHALERRLRGGMTDAGVRFGWSHFPEDGASLDVLLHKARAGLPRPPGLVTRPAGAVPTVEVESE